MNPNVEQTSQDLPAALAVTMTGIMALVFAGLAYYAFMSEIPTLGLKILAAGGWAILSIICGVGTKRLVDASLNL